MRASLTTLLNSYKAKTIEELFANSPAGCVRALQVYISFCRSGLCSRSDLRVFKKIDSNLTKY